MMAQIKFRVLEKENIPKVTLFKQRLLWSEFVAITGSPQVITKVARWKVQTSDVGLESSTA